MVMGLLMKIKKKQCTDWRCNVHPQHKITVHNLAKLQDFEWFISLVICAVTAKQ